MGDLEASLLGTDPEDSCVESNFVPGMERNSEIFAVCSSISIICKFVDSLSMTASAEDLKIIKVSRFVILSEMLRCLNGDVCARECENTVNGYSSYVKVRVPV